MQNKLNIVFVGVNSTQWTNGGHRHIARTIDKLIANGSKVFKIGDKEMSTADDARALNELREFITTRVGTGITKDWVIIMPPIEALIANRNNDYGFSFEAAAFINRNLKPPKNTYLYDQPNESSSFKSERLYNLLVALTNELQTQQPQPKEITMQTPMTKIDLAQILAQAAVILRTEPGKESIYDPEAITRELTFVRDNPEKFFFTKDPQIHGLINEVIGAMKPNNDMNNAAKEFLALQIDNFVMELRGELRAKTEPEPPSNSMIKTIDAVIDYLFNDPAGAAVQRSDLEIVKGFLMSQAAKPDLTPQQTENTTLNQEMQASTPSEGEREFKQYLDESFNGLASIMQGCMQHIDKLLTQVNQLRRDFDLGKSLMRNNGFPDESHPDYGTWKMPAPGQPLPSQTFDTRKPLGQPFGQMNNPGWQNPGGVGGFQQPFPGAERPFARFGRPPMARVKSLKEYDGIIMLHIEDADVDAEARKRQMIFEEAFPDAKFFLVRSSEYGNQTPAQRIAKAIGMATDRHNTLKVYHLALGKSTHGVFASTAFNRLMSLGMGVSVIDIYAVGNIHELYNAVGDSMAYYIATHYHLPAAR